jgi:hypothetical protein
MTRDEILAFVPSKWNVPTHFGAGSYAVPTIAWLRGPFWDFFHGRLWDTNLDKWKVRWECRDFARAYACMAQECWAATQGGTEDDGLAVGEIWFIPEAPKPTEGHAICPVITGDGLSFIDPQNNSFWQMTPTQFESRYFVRF